jgi:hypothetical protein
MMYCRLRLGHVHRMLGHFADALADFGRCLDLKPDYLPAASGLAVCYTKKAASFRSTRYCKRFWPVHLR